MSAAANAAASNFVNQSVHESPPPSSAPERGVNNGRRSPGAASKFINQQQEGMIERSSAPLRHSKVDGEPAQFRRSSRAARV